MLQCKNNISNKYTNFLVNFSGDKFQLFEDKNHSTNNGGYLLGQDSFELIFDSLPHCLLIVDKSYIIVYANKAYLHATHRQRNELIGKRMFDAFPDNPDDPYASGVRNLRASFDKVIQEGIAHKLSHQKYDIPCGNSHQKTFEEHYWDATNYPVIDEHGETKYIIHEVRDVTEMIKSAPAINQAFNENILLHELSQPLTVMSLCAQNAIHQLEQNNRNASENAKHLLNSINNQVKIAGDIIKSNKKSYNSYISEKINLYRIINELEAHLSFLKLSCNVKIVKSLPPQPLPLSINKTQLYQVILNLVINAIEAASDIKLNGILIRIKGQVISNQFEIQIISNGPTIPKKIRKKIFEPYYTTKQNGTGLGLFICRSILRVHKGAISIPSSNRKEGTCFKIMLPLLKE